ncbi:MAG: GNAT family N-acetyltransferase [Alphaproteobacteria bacterium]
MKKINEIIKGERIELRRLRTTEENFEFIKNLASSNKDHFLPWDESLYNLKDFQQRIDYFYGINYGWENNKEWHFGIFLKDALIGVLNLRTFGDAKADLGLGIDKAHTRKGYMQEAVLLLEKEFFTKGFNKITWRVDEKNTASIELAKKLGYNCEGLLKDDCQEKDGFSSLYQYAKLKSDWNKKNAR